MFTEQRLFNRNFVLLSLCNLTFTTSFNLILPVLPLYLTDDLGASKTALGLILACYSVAALLMRPISGWLVDSFPRRRILIIFMIPFCFSFIGYIFLSYFLLIAMLRFLHGLAFGAVGTTVSTMAVDTIPLNKLGTGVGFLGITNSLSLAIGPMLGMLLLDYISFYQIFLVCTSIALVSFGIGLLVKLPRDRLSGAATPGKGVHLENFFLRHGLGAFLCLLLAALPYGLMLNFISIYVREHAININPGYYFCVLAVGLVISRLFSGKLVDMGFLTQSVVFGQVLSIASFVCFIKFHGDLAFFGSALLMGLGYGIIAPAYQTMLLLLADAEHRGTASSMFLIAWDLGIGASVLIGGWFADMTSLNTTFWSGTSLLGVSTVLFALFIARNYKRRRQLLAKAAK